jgi:hypothetical protein
MGKDPRSFADLVVREIQQYYPNEVAQGKANRDLYRRLRNEIDVRWSLYAKRFPEEQTDYFYERLVATLGQGDVSSFGPGFPSSTERRRRRMQNR